MTKEKLMTNIYEMVANEDAFLIEEEEISIILNDGAFRLATPEDDCYYEDEDYVEVKRKFKNKKLVDKVEKYFKANNTGNSDVYLDITLEGTNFCLYRRYEVGEDELEDYELPSLF